jgi:hypothetical protein
MIARNPAAPLVTRVEIKVGEMMFKNRPVPSHDRATVFLDRYGRYHHLTEQLPVGGVAGYKTLFLVDTSVVSRHLQLMLPSRDQASYFTAKATVTWRISDPVEAAKTHLVDVTQVVNPHVERVLRDIAITFPIEEGTAAERAMVHAFTGSRARQQLPQGISVLSCDTTLTLDANTINHIRRRTEGSRTHLVKKEDLVRSVIETSAEQQIAEMRHQHELQLKRMEHEHQLQLERQRVEMYSGVQHDQDRLIAITLANDPSKAADLLALTMKRQQAEMDDARGVLDVALEHGLATRSDVAGILGRATSTITRGMAGPSGSRPTPLSHVPRAAAYLEDALTAEVVSDEPGALFDSLDFDDEDEDDL